MKNTIKVDSIMKGKNVDEELKPTEVQDKLLSTDTAMQEFLRKVTRIIALLLKDQTAPKELHKSVLRFLKIVITFLTFENEATSRMLCELIVSHVFSLRNSAKYTMIIRRILNKLISRVGLPTVLACTSTEHHKLIHYIERARRKIRNAKERQKFILA